MKKIKIMIVALSLLTGGVFAADSININTASKNQLMSLKGVGESKASAIIKYRKQQKFKSSADVKNVPGIGDKIYQDNVNKLKVSGNNRLDKKIKEN